MSHNTCFPLSSFIALHRIETVAYQMGRKVHGSHNKQTKKNCQEPGAAIIDTQWTAGPAIGHGEPSAAVRFEAHTPCQGWEPLFTLRTHSVFLFTDLRGTHFIPQKTHQILQDPHGGRWKEDRTTLPHSSPEQQFPGLGITTHSHGAHRTLIAGAFSGAQNWSIFLQLWCSQD